MSFLDRFMDYSAVLRSSKECIGRITVKRFTKDAGFGDCAMQIAYEFQDGNGKTYTGRHVGTENSYYGVSVGDPIVIRYVASNPKRNAPLDALGIIRRASEGTAPERGVPPGPLLHRIRDC